MLRAAIATLATLLCALPVRGERLLLDPARETFFFAANTGSEFPGATADLDVAQDPEAGACVRARLRFAGESRYAGLEWRGSVEGKSLGFRVKMSARDNGVLRVRDASDQWLSGSFQARRGAWSEVTLPLTPASFPSHWAGANDGQIHFPLRAVLIGTYRGPDTQEMLLSNLFVETGAITPAERWQVLVHPGVPSGIALAGESVEYRAAVTNRVQTAAHARLVVDRQAPGGEPAPVGSWEVAAGPWETREFRFSLPSGQTGYWRLRAAVRDEKAGTTATAVSGLAVVPRPRQYGRPAPACYFGMQSIPDMEVAERLGAKAIRHFLFWKFTEGREGQPRWEIHDRVVEAAARHNMQVMITVVLRAPAWAAWNLPGNPKARELPDPARLGDWERFVRQVAERYRGRVQVIELENEPDLTCGPHVGLPLEQGAEYYARFLRAGRAAIKAVDPAFTVAGLDVSGVDFDKEFVFTRAVLAQSAEMLDLYTGHPYASPRNFGSGLHPKWPVANRMGENLRRALDILAEHGRPRRMWIGELGWALRNTADPLSPEALEFGACIAQSLIVGKSVPGVERYLHFTQSGCNEGGHEYGLTRGDPGYPLPAALNYAAAAWVLEGAAPVETAQAGPALWRSSFACPERGELVVAWWADEEGQAAQIPAGAPAGRWTDVLLREVHPRKGRVPVGRLPVFWTLPLKQSGRQPAFVRQVRQVAARPLEVRHLFLSAADRVTVEMVNHTGKPQNVEAVAAGRHTRLLLPAGEGPVRREVALPAPVPVGRRSEVPLALTGPDLSDRRALETDLLPLPAPPAGCTVDGDLSEWRGLPPLSVQTRQEVLPPDGTVGWEGTADLSLRAWVAADARGLHFACAVADDVHAAPQDSPARFWQSDSIQLALDPECDSRDAFDEDDREIGLVLGKEGPRLVQDHPAPARALDAPVAIRRGEGETFYEALLPWAALGLPAPRPGQVLALDFIANDNDGAGRGYWMGLTPGIGEGKSPQSYRRFVFGR